MTQIILAAHGVNMRQLAALLGLPVFAVMHEFITMGLFFPNNTQLDGNLVRRLCARLGVRVTFAS